MSEEIKKESKKKKNINILGKVQDGPTFDLLNVRDDPSYAGEKICSLKKGTDVTIIGKPNKEWVKISFISDEGINTEGFALSCFIDKYEEV